MPKPGTVNTLLTLPTGGVTTTPLIAKTQAPSGFNFANTPSPSQGANFNVATQQPNPINFGALQMVNGQQNQGAPAPQAVPQNIPPVTTTPAENGATPTNTSTPTTTQNTATTPTFPGLVGSLVNTANSNQAIGTQAQAIGQDYSNRIAALLPQVNAGSASALASGGTTPVLAGNEAAAAQTAAAETGQLQTAEQAALNPLSTALSATGQQQSGLGTAISAAQPSGTYPFVFNPLTQSFTNTGGGVVTPTQAASAVLSGQMSYSQAVSSLGYMGSTGESQLQSQILSQNPNANINTLAAQGAGSASVEQTIPQLQSANTAAQGISNQITSYLASNPSLNPSQLVASNAVQQWLQGQQISSPQYQTLFDYLSEYANTLAPILGVGGDPTNLKTEISQGFINAAASGGSIATVLNNINTLASTKIQNLASGAQGSTTPTAGGSGSFVEGQNVSAGGYNYVYKNGQWIAQ